MMFRHTDPVTGQTTYMPEPETTQGTPVAPVKFLPILDRPTKDRVRIDHTTIHAKARRGVRMKARPRMAAIWTMAGVRIPDGRKAAVPLHVLPEVRANLAAQGYTLPQSVHEVRNG